MHTVAFDEASGLLARPLTGEPPSDWLPAKSQIETFEMTCGLLDEDGAHTRLHVELAYRRSAKTGLKRFKFSVFLRQRYGIERVYQLDVLQSKKAIRDKHSMPHEHFGDRRTNGTESWQNWTFEEILGHFQKRTNIIFRPPPSHPEHFELRGT